MSDPSASRSGKAWCEDAASDGAAHGFGEGQGRCSVERAEGRVDEDPFETVGSAKSGMPNDWQADQRAVAAKREGEGQAHAFAA